MIDGMDKKMKQANNSNVTFWGCLIMSQTAHNIWVSWAFLMLAAYTVYRFTKEELKNEQGQTDLDNSGRGEHGCTNGTCEQSCQPKQRRNRTKTTQVPSKE